MEQQLAQILQAVVAQNQQMQEQTAALARMVEGNREQMTQLQQTQVLQTATMQDLMRRGREGVVDVTRVGKPDNLKGNTKTDLKRAWPDWSYTFKTWFCSQWRNGEAILKWASEMYDTQLDEEALRGAIQDHPGWAEKLAPLSRQLHVSLTALCKDESLSMVKNALKGDCMGLDAWRRLCKEYDPVNALSNRRLLRKLTHPQQVSLDNLRKTIEEWESNYREYRDRTGKELDDDQMSLSIQDMCPDSMREHLELQASRLNSYSLIRKEVDAYLDTRAARESGGAVPMDIGSMARHEQRSRQTKGKPSKCAGKGDFQGGKSGDVPKCMHCQKPVTANHTEWDCWYNPKNPKPEAVAKRKAKAAATPQAAARKGARGGKGGKKGVRSLKSRSGLTKLLLKPRAKNTLRLCSCCRQKMRQTMGLQGKGAMSRHVIGFMVSKQSGSMKTGAAQFARSCFQALVRSRHSS